MLGCCTAARLHGCTARGDAGLLKAQSGTVCVKKVLKEGFVEMRLLVETSCKWHRSLGKRLRACGSAAEQARVQWKCVEI